jgi:hypothetical protein
MNHIWILLPSLRTILWCIALASPIVLPCVLYRFVLILLNVSYRKVLIRLNFSWSSFILFLFLVRSFVSSLNYSEKGKNAIYCNAIYWSFLGITWEQRLAMLMLSPHSFINSLVPQSPVRVWKREKLKARSYSAFELLSNRNLNNLVFN